MTPCAKCGNPRPATEYNGSSPTTCLTCRGVVPARPLAVALDALRERTGWSRASIFADVPWPGDEGLGAETVDKWRTGETRNVSVARADAVLFGIHRNWVDVYTPETVPCPFALARCADLFDALPAEEDDLADLLEAA